MKYRLYIIYILLLLPVTQIVAQQENFKNQVDEIVQHLNTKNSAGLLDMMADSCRIGNLPKTENKVALPQILAKFDSISAFQIAEERTSNNGSTLVLLHVTYQHGKEGRPTFLFNTAGDLVNLGIIKARLTADPVGALSDAVKVSARPDTARIAFQMMNGIIYVPAMLNGQEGYFMFDSGAPVVILRKKYVSQEHINKDITVDFTGMGGMMHDVQWATANTVAWGGGSLANLDAPVAAMDDMELETGAVIFGLMGYGVLEGYQITFDYAQQELLLERVDDGGNLVGASFDKGKHLSSAPMRMKRHIPIIDVVAEENSYPMGIDCGANANVITTEAARSLGRSMDYEDDEVSIAGVGASAENNRVGFLMNTKVGSLALDDMYTAVTDQVIGAGKGDDALPIVGLLGTPFLMLQKTTLNFNKGEISFYR